MHCNGINLLSRRQEREPEDVTVLLLLLAGFLLAVVGWLSLTAAACDVVLAVLADNTFGVCSGWWTDNRSKCCLNTCIIIYHATNRAPLLESYATELCDTFDTSISIVSTNISIPVSKRSQYIAKPRYCKVSWYNDIMIPVLIPCSLQLYHSIVDNYCTLCDSNKKSMSRKSLSSMFNNAYF